MKQNDRVTKAPLSATYTSCKWIEEHVEFSCSDSLHYCCYLYPDEEGRSNGHVKALDLMGENFPHNELIAERERIRRMIADGEECVCLKCPNLETRPWPKTEYLLQLLTINSWTECNLRCNYCFTKDIDIHYRVRYNLRAMISNILENNRLDPDGTVCWGGGDISSLKDFEDISSMIHHYGANQLIKTSGVKYSKTAEQVLHSGKGTLEISLDAGTRETFLAVKGKDKFDLVVNSIQRYANAGPLSLKYIIFRDNNQIEDLRGFLDICKTVSVQGVTITPEWNELLTGSVSDDTLKGAAWLVHHIRKEGIPVSPYTPESIDSIFHSSANRLKSIIESNDFIST